MVLVGLGLDASAHRTVSQPADRPIDIRLVTFHGQVHDQEMPLARQVRAADDTRTSSAGPPTTSDLKRKATEHGVAAIRQDAREPLDYSVRTYYTKAGITCLQRTTTLPDGVRVRGSHCVTIGEHGEIRGTFHPAAGDRCHEEFEQLGNAIRFEAEKPPDVHGTRRAANWWCCRLDERPWQRGRARLIEFFRAAEDAWREHERQVVDGGGRHVAVDTQRTK